MTYMVQIPTLHNATLILHGQHNAGIGSWRMAVRNIHDTLLQSIGHGGTAGWNDESKSGENSGKPGISWYILSLHKFHLPRSVALKALSLSACLRGRPSFGGCRALWTKCFNASASTSFAANKAKDRPCGRDVRTAKDRRDAKGIKGQHASGEFAAKKRGSSWFSHSYVCRSNPSCFLIPVIPIA